jgi:hypothetical protein
MLTLILLLILGGNPDSVCAERGHIKIPIEHYCVELEYGHIDYEDSTVVWMWQGDYMLYECQRCHSQFKVYDYDTIKTTIWRRPQEEIRAREEEEDYRLWLMRNYGRH